MKKNIHIIVFFVFGLIAGVLFSGITLNYSAGHMMIKEMNSPYGYEKTIEMIVDRIGRQPGWHVVQVIDQQMEVKKYGGGDIGKVSIIQYCNGQFSGQMLSSDERLRMSVMMPKTLSVYETSTGEIMVASANGAVMGKLFGGETGEIIEEVSLDVENILRFMNFKFSVF